MYKLTDPADFLAVTLYNALERDLEYKVDPRDILNYKVLQRQANFTVNMNHKRF